MRRRPSRLRCAYRSRRRPRASVPAPTGGARRTSSLADVAHARAVRAPTTPRSTRPLRRLPRRRHARAEVVGERLDGGPCDEHVVARDPDARGRSAEERELETERELVDGAFPDQCNARAEKDDMQEAAP